MNVKQEYEMQIVQSFLRTIEERAIEIEAHDRPDVIITLQMPNSLNIQHAGVEVRRHFNDEIIGKGSGGQRLNNFWATVQGEIEKLKSQAGQLYDVYVYVHLKKDILMQAGLSSLEKKLAEEIFGFVREASKTITSSIIVVPEWKERKFCEFHGYSIMQKYVREIKVCKGFFAFWGANVTATYIGISARRMAEIIGEKGERAKSWNTEGLDELWLLIAAPHDTVFNAMHDWPDQANLDDPIVLAECRISRFDKIFFWSSYPNEWAKQIWPQVT
jgi:hypothetical protein